MFPDDTDELTAFRRMASDYPVRTAIFSLGLPAFAVLQIVNGIVNGGSVALVAALAALTVVYAVFLTRYQVAAYRRAELVGGWSTNRQRSG